jgi:putative endonuclease
VTLITLLKGVFINGSNPFIVSVLTLSVSLLDSKKHFLMENHIYSKKSTSYALGVAAEDLVARHYAALGAILLKTRYKTKDGELDLILKYQDNIVFIEVKRRKTLPEGLEAITPPQQKRLLAAAAHYLAEVGTPDALCRFDAAVVLPDGTVHLICNIDVT